MRRAYGSSSRNVRLVLYITPDMEADLKKIATNCEYTISSLCYLLLQDFIAKNEAPDA